MELINEVVLNESHSETWLGGVENIVSAFGAYAFHSSVLERYWSRD